MPPAAPTHPRFRIGWLLVAGAIGIAVFSAVAIDQLRNRAAQYQRHEATLLRIELSANRLNGLEWQAIALGKITPELKQSVNTTLTEMQDLMAALAHGPTRLPHETEMQALFHTYLTAIQAEFALLEAGQLEAAKELDETRVDPAYSALFSHLGEIIRQFSPVVARSLSEARLWTYGITVLGVCSLAAFYHSSHRRLRHTELRVAAETEGLLLTHNAELEARVQQRTAELRASEEQLKHALDATSEGLWDWHIATGVVHFSPQWARLLGYEPAEVPQQVEFFFTVLHPEDVARTRRLLDDHLAGRVPTKESNVRLKTKSGEYRWFRDRGKVVNRGPNHEPLRMVGTIADITEQHAAEEARRATEARLRHTQKIESLGTLAGGIAHDFNNILTGMLGAAQVAATEIPADHPATHWLQRIAAGGARAKTLVQQILTFSRKNEGQLVVQPLQPVVTEAVALLRSSIPPIIRIETDISPACAPVLADSTQMHQVVMNLCTNAWHAVSKENALIEVSLTPAPLTPALAHHHPALPPGDYVRLAIRDNGTGMSPEVRKRLFEPFFTTKPQGQGTGLGLAVVHGIVEGHQGSIAVESHPGQGTLFEILLPCHPGARPQATVV
jgi:PAS domain S-box-containing protein